MTTTKSQLQSPLVGFYRYRSTAVGNNFFHFRAPALLSNFLRIFGANNIILDYFADFSPTALT